MLQRLREDIDSVLGSGPGSQKITYKTLKEMKYLTCVIKEGKFTLLAGLLVFQCILSIRMLTVVGK